MTKSKSIADANASRLARRKSSTKERQRNVDLNHAFTILQDRIASIPNDQKLPRIKTLRLAQLYIVHLQRVLSGEYISGPLGDRPLEINDFAQTAMNEMQARNSYVTRLHGVTRVEKPSRRSTHIDWDETSGGSTTQKTTGFDCSSMSESGDSPVGSSSSSTFHLVGPPSQLHIQPPPPPCPSSMFYASSTSSSLPPFVFHHPFSS